MFARTRPDLGHARRVCISTLVAVASTISATPARSESDSRPVPYRQTSDAELARLFFGVRQDPRSIEGREALARRYRELGFARIAKLYEASAGFLRTGRLGKIPSSHALRWLCPSTGREVRALQAAIAATVTPRSRVAVDAAEKALGENGFCCELAVEWSRAYLFAPSGGVTQEEASLEEEATRTLVTLGDDGNVHPDGLEGAAAVYEFLAGVYSLQKDYAMAFTMATAAKTQLSEGSVTGSQERRSFETELDSELQSLKRLAESMRARAKAM